MTDADREDRPNNGRPRVLVVDDEPENVALVVRALRGTFEVDGTSSVEEALTLANDTGPQYVAIFCDQRLPNKNGSALLSELGAHAPYAERVLMSGYAEYNDLVEAINIGAVDCYIEKPMSASQLRAIAENALRNFQEHAQARAQSEGKRPSRRVSEGPEAFRTDLRVEINRAAQDGDCFSLMMLEVGGAPPGAEVWRRATAVLEGAEPGVGPRRTDAVASIGAGEFAVFLRRTPKDQAMAVAMRIAANLRNAFRADPDGQDATVTIGLAEFPRDGNSYESLLDAASKAVELAKENGGDLVIAYDKQLVRSTQRGSLRHWAKRVEAVEATIRERNFSLAYQPIVDMTDREVIAYEALCRPARTKFDSPTELFSLASGIGAVGRLGQAIRERICTDVKLLPSGRSLFINLHPDELLDERFVASLAELTLLGDRLVLEVTEVAELREVNRVSRALSDLREHGIRVAVDDFGAGHSGVSRLLHLNPDYIKLDASLMRMIGNGEKTDRFIRFLLDFCAAEQIEVVAEGVEHPSQMSRLVDMGINLGQGFFFARPLKGFLEDLG